MRLQRTIKKEITFSGIGLHTGKYTTVRLRPAPRDTGVIFYRIDRFAVIKANISSVVDTAFATTIGYKKGSEIIRIRTVEHLLAAISGLGIDNLIVEVDGPEIPVLDGSSTELIEIILKAGIAKQGKNMPYIKIIHPVVYEDAHSKIVALPYNKRRLSYHINFGHHLLDNQEISLDINEETFIKEIAPARTFGFLKDIEKLRARGLAKGGSLDNAIIVGDKGILNSNGLRFEDEFVRHKVLDAVGDLSMLGLPIIGHIMLDKAGHTANINFLKKLATSVDCYDIITTESDSYQTAPVYV
jgi:UDP-3-O-[3-hydroxymyristoyl] N-acetylglucosamine deacetylase